MAAAAKRSPWFWISLLIIIGLFAGFILFLDQKVVKNSARSNPAKPQPESGEGPVFDFYTVLPERGVDIPEPVESLPKQGENANSPALKDARYLLQAGSFARPEDAERRRAELAFLGIESTVQQASVDGRIYHRVELGPFADDGRLSRIKTQLIENDINYIAKSLP